MRLLLLVPTIAATLLTPLPAQRADSAAAARAALRHAGALLAAGDTAAAADSAVAARTAWPRQPAYRLTAARLAALAGRSLGALDELSAFVAMGGGWPADDPALASLHSDPRYRALVTTAALGAPASRQVVALPATMVHAEGVASDPAGRRLFVSLVAPGGVAVVDPDRAPRLAIDARQHGLGAVFGIAVDTARNRLWVTTGPLPGTADTTTPAALVAFDLTSLALVGQWTVPTDGRSHHLGDVVIGPDGAVWVTDSGDPAIWGVGDVGRNGQLVRTPLAHPDWRSLQGLAFEPSGRRGWIADWSTGLFRFDLDRAEVVPVTGDPGLVTLGIDGLYRAGPRRLVAIQNGMAPARVVLLELSAHGDSVVALRTMDRLPGPGEPTLGTLTAAGLVFVAGAPWPLLGPDGAIRPGAAAPTQEIRIVALPDSR